MPAFIPLQGPLTKAAQAAADQLAIKYAGTPTRFYPSFDRSPAPPSQVSFSSPSMVWRKGRGAGRVGFGLWIRPHATGKATSVPKRTRENIAACASLGLSFWSEAPPNSALWALDSAQTVHMVSVNRGSGTAVHLCGIGDAQSYRDTRGLCPWSGNSADYAAPDSDAALWELADPRPARDAEQTTIQATDREPARRKLKIDQQLLLYVAAQIRENNSAITTLDAEILAALYSTRQYSSSLTLSVSVARDLMPLIEAEIKRRAEAANECATNMREAAIA